ncbi:fungal-specific transcription factor domain-containing protein [Aspergillus californicus]
MPAKKTRGPYRVGLPAKRRCWTCRDRKISCDMGRPHCRNCTESGRKCQGYGLRLSWPPAGSSRSIEHSGEDNVARISSTYKAHRAHFVNTLMVDVELHYMRDSEGVGISTTLPLRSWCIFPLSNLANARPAAGDEQHLVTFFMTTVVSSLTPIRSDGYKLWKLLFQLSFSDDSPASMAVLRAMLSLASLYRYGHGDEPLRLKVAALNSLSSSMNGVTTGTREIYQHVAVGMLLCAFEIYLPSESSFQWPLYLSGAKSMLHEICDGGHPMLVEFDVLILWVHYHDILGKFASRHWKIESAENASMFRVPGTAASLVHAPQDQVLGLFGCSLEMINLIAKMSRFQPDCPAANVVHFTNEESLESLESLESIEHDLITLSQDTSHLIGTNSPEEVEHGAITAKLYQLAGLIYLERALKPTSSSSSSASSSSIRVAKWAAEAFGLISRLDICERPFPLFFIACEAHTDAKRDLILCLLERTQRRSGQRGLHIVQGMIESMWVQHDLHLDLDGVCYVDALNAVMSSNELLPTLA